MGTIYTLPKEERPRERFLKQGADSLSLTELLAICLGNGTKKRSVLHLAEELLTQFGSLKHLLSASTEELTKVKGIGPVKAIQLQAMFALAKKITKPAGSAKFVVKSPQDVFFLIHSELQYLEKETLFILLRDVKGVIFHHEMVAVGILSEVLIHPREIFALAVKRHAYSFILAHNHPSGDPTPSSQDLKLTKSIYSSSLMMGTRLDDHLIIGNSSYVSLWEKGLFPHAKY